MALLIYESRSFTTPFCCQIVMYFPFMARFFPYNGDDVSSLSMSGLGFQVFPFFSKHSVVIYPEVVVGNPLGAKHIMRWLLYHYKYEDNPTAFGKDDLFVAFREVFDSPDLNPTHNVVQINSFNSSLYCQYNFGERKGRCYILRKGRNRSDLPDKFDGPVFDDDMTQKELVKMFNEHKYCYSYDTQTFYTSIAAVCGCIPVVVLEDGKSVSDYLSPNETHYGIAYGDTPEQIQYAIDTRDKLLSSLDYSDNNRKNAQELVNILEERFGKIKRL